jgi:RNA polymerase sigma factor (sigma-70 family)
MQDEAINELVKACLRGNPQAQKRFYDKYKRKLFGICCRYAHTTADADDIFHDAMVKIFGKLNTLKDLNTNEAWVKSITTSTAIDFYRKGKALFLLVENYETCVNTSNEADDFDILDSMEQCDILNIIATLPNGYRTILNMYLIDGYSHVQIAEMLNISVGTSKSQYSRARNILKIKLAEIGIKRDG